NPAGMRALPVKPKLPKPADTLYVLGFPGGQNLNTSYPATYQGAVTTHRFQYQGVANQGNSGGPILDSEGYVVGIVSSNENIINSVPINNTYLGVPAADLPVPSGFDVLSVRPLFLSLNAMGSMADTNNASSWTVDEARRVLDEYKSTENTGYCKMKIP